MGKKNKVPTLKLEDALRLIDQLDKFGAPGDKGRHDRAHTGAIIVDSVRTHAIKREDLTERFRLSSEKVSTIMNGGPAGLSEASRSIIFSDVRKACNAVIAASEAPPALEA